MPQSGTEVQPVPAPPRVPDRWCGGYRQSALILGGAQLGGYGPAAATPVGPTVALLRTAAELGVTHIDTARAYGASEQRLGAALPALPADTFALVTKVAPLATPDGGARADAGHVAVAVEESVARSRETLGVERLAVLLHRTADAWLAGGAAWEQLRRLRARGVATRIGVAIQRPDELPAVLALPELDYLQLPCNILDRRWLAPAVSEALLARPDLVVSVRSVFLQGLLAAGRAVRWPGLPDADRDELITTLDRLAVTLGRPGRDELCLAYVRSLPWVTSAVIGAESADQLRQHAALVRGAPLSAAERDWVRDAVPAVPEELLDPCRWRTPAAALCP
ncbi:oxidoreductase [Pilimelia terevasa]|uniref:Oxidoreductase n=1 Tax=Pilimelia terevasa TaxID=53372 RepID=A0A8J3BQH4_9ACTN|nr:aldo/keto reductase [Pilimelia terevasa]GGK35830.1 oxidoreductase [Pilimelia terevasa]